jgi:hypothetical protein
MEQQGQKPVHSSIENGVGNRSSAWVHADNLTMGEIQWAPLILIRADAKSASVWHKA